MVDHEIRRGAALTIAAGIAALVLVSAGMAFVEQGNDIGRLLLDTAGFDLNQGNYSIPAATGENGRPITRSSSGYRLPAEEIRVIIQFSDEPLLTYAAGLKTGLKDMRNDAIIKAHKDLILNKNSEIKKQIIQKNITLKITGEFHEVFNGIAADISKDDIIQLREIPGIKAIYTDKEVSVLLSDSVSIINATKVWQMQDAGGRNITGKNVKVAIIDTGIDYTHPDLGGGFGPGYKVIGGWDVYNNDPDPMDDHGHGTHVAGIVTANGSLRGVAPDALLMAYKVLDNTGNGNDSDVIAAMEMALDPDGNPLTKDGADIISMSLGGTGDPDDPLSQVVDSAVDYGAVVVVAAGNSGPSSSTILSPGTARKAITVGATYKSDSIAGFSSRGPVVWMGGVISKPDIIAPGVSIYSTVPAGPCKLCSSSRYLYLSGTSMATPMVSGTAALLLQKDPESSPLEIKKALEETAKNLSYDINTQGYGRIDALKAAYYLPPIEQTKHAVIVDDDLEDDPANHTWNTIQEGIDNANESDIVYVRNGTYKENIVVSKSIFLFGEDNNNTVIDGRNNGNVVVIRAEDVQISGFKIMNGKPEYPVPEIIIRGEVSEGSFTWTPENFGAFWYDVDEDSGGEFLRTVVNGRNIYPNDLAYNTTGREVGFRYSPFGRYEAIGFLGEKYFAGYTENSSLTSYSRISPLNSSQLHSVLKDEDQKRAISEGGSLVLEEGYTIDISNISGDQISLSLLKDGIEVDRTAIVNGATYVYSRKVGNVSDLPIIAVHIDSLFSGNSNVVFIKGIFQISESFRQVNTGGIFGGLVITEISADSIKMQSNSWTITLNRDTTVDIAGNLKFKVADSDALRYYPAFFSVSPGFYELRGSIARDTEAKTWDAYSFPGFFYDLNDDIKPERLEILAIAGRTIENENLTYETHIAPRNFNVYRYKGILVNGQANYSVTGWQGEKYVAINGNISKLSRLIKEHGASAAEKKTLTVGETWEVGDGWTFTAGSIDARARPRIAALSLGKDGNMVMNSTIRQGEAFVYSADLGGETDVPIFVTYLDSVFAGATTDMVQVRYIWLISQDVTEIKSGDVFGKMKVMNVTDEKLVLKNRYAFSLYKGGAIDLFGNIKFKVADSPELRYYPVVRRSISTGESGIELYHSSGISITNVTILNSSTGIYLNSVSNNILSGNILTNNILGIKFAYSSQNVLTNNNLYANEYNIKPVADGIALFNYDKEYFNNSIAISNEVNGRPVHYYFNKSNITLDGIGTDHLTLAFSNGFNIENCSIGGDGVNLYYSNSNEIRDISERVSQKRDPAAWQIVRQFETAWYNRSITAFDSPSQDEVLLQAPPPVSSGGGGGGGGGIRRGVNLYNSSYNNVSGNILDIALRDSSNNLLRNNNASIILLGSSDNIIDNNRAQNSSAGIYLGNSYGNVLSNNVASNNTYGIFLMNEVLECDYFGICRRFTLGNGNNILSDNAARNNYVGIYLSSSNNTLIDNMMSGNEYNFDGYYDNRIDTSNSVDGKPVYIVHGAENAVYDLSTSAGLIYCIDCNNITIKDLVLAGNGAGIYLLNTTGSRLYNLTSSDNYYGMYLHNSSNNAVVNNTIIRNKLNGIYGNGIENLFNGNNVSNNPEYGIYVWGSNNSIENNDFSNNKVNIFDGPFNKVSHNNFINNTYQAYGYYGSNSWDDGYPSGGNYWSDYSGADDMRGSFQDISGSDGIGDIPYNISGYSGQDRYPFMNRSGWLTMMISQPVADCGHDKLRCENAGSPVGFNGSASYDPDGSITTYLWEFGDGKNGSGAAPKHTYIAYRWNGTAYLPFIVNLTVIDNDGLANSTSQKVVIWMTGDANGDGRVNILDIALVGLRWEGNDPCADVNNDGRVNILDAAIMGLNWGKNA